MTVEGDGLWPRGESGALDAASLSFTRNKFFNEQRIFSQRQSGCSQLLGDQIRILITEAENTGRFEADERSAFRDDVLQQLDVADRQLLGGPHESFG